MGMHHRSVFTPGNTNKHKRVSHSDIIKLNNHGPVIYILFEVLLNAMYHVTRSYTIILQSNSNNSMNILNSMKSYDFYDTFQKKQANGLFRKSLFCIRIIRHKQQIYYWNRRGIFISTQSDV